MLVVSGRFAIFEYKITLFINSDSLLILDNRSRKIGMISWLTPPPNK